MKNLQFPGSGSGSVLWQWDKMHGYSNRTRLISIPLMMDQRLGDHTLSRYKRILWLYRAFYTISFEDPHYPNRTLCTSLVLPWLCIIKRRSIFDSCPRFHKQQGQPEGLKLQKEIENMPKEYKPLSKMQQISMVNFSTVSLHAPTVRNCWNQTSEVKAAYPYHTWQK